jgi:hypothetical protein
MNLLAKLGRIAPREYGRISSVIACQPLQPLVGRMTGSGRKKRRHSGWSEGSVSIGVGRVGEIG